MISSILALSRTSAMSSSRIRPATPGVYGGVPTARPGNHRPRGVGRRHENLDHGGDRSGSSTSTTGGTGHTAHDDPTLGALVHDLTQQVPQLIRSEIRLAQAEMTEKGKRAGLGIGMFSGAGLLAFFGLACVIATAILGLAHALPDWLSA